MNKIKKMKENEYIAISFNEWNSIDKGKEILKCIPKRDYAVAKRHNQLIAYEPISGKVWLIT